MHFIPYTLLANVFLVKRSSFLSGLREIFSHMGTIKNIYHYAAQKMKSSINDFFRKCDISAEDFRTSKYTYMGLYWIGLVQINLSSTSENIILGTNFVAIFSWMFLNNMKFCV